MADSRLAFHDLSVFAGVIFEYAEFDFRPIADYVQFLFFHKFIPGNSGAERIAAAMSQINTKTSES